MCLQIASFSCIKDAKKERKEKKLMIYNWAKEAQIMSSYASTHKKPSPYYYLNDDDVS